MTVESVTYIEDLDENYPAEGEVGTLHEGNDHIRNIKKGVKNSWALAAKLTPSTEQTLTVPTTGPWGVFKFGAGYADNVWEVQNASAQVTANLTAYNAIINLYGQYSAGGSCGLIAWGTVSNNFATVLGNADGAQVRVARASSGSGSNNPYEFSAPNTTDLFYVSNTGQVAGTGSFVALSDERDKTNVEECSAGLAAVLALRPVTFEYLVRPGEINYGFIAQEVQAVLPETVKQYSNKDDRLGLAYEQLLAPLVRAVQELAARVAELESRMGDI